MEAFIGFKPAMEACSLSWDDYVISGVTYSKTNVLFEGDQTSCLLSHDSSLFHGTIGRPHSTINSSGAVLNCQVPAASAIRLVNEEDAGQGNDDEIESDLSTSPENGDMVPLALLRSVDNEDEGVGVGGASSAPANEELVGNDSSSSSPSLASSGHTTNASNANGKNPDEFNVYLGHLKKLEDPLEVLFARAEALHAHGFSSEASTLAVQLADELLAHPPDLMVDFPPPPMTKHKRRRYRVNPVSHQTSCLASATLAKSIFLCSVLSESVDFQSLAFRVGLFGLELARPPASTKALEVKMANQELELVSWLKKIPLSKFPLNRIFL
jgi:hypothetical protein